MKRMDLQIEFHSDANGWLPVRQVLEVFEKHIALAVQEHPFYSSDVRPPESLKVDVAFVDADSTAIDHRSFPTEQRVCLQINEFYSRLDRGGLRERLVRDDGQVHDALPRLLLHEIGHLIDARIDLSFGFADDLRPPDPAVLTLHHHLWDSFIDGRLGEWASHSLDERIHEARSTSSVPPDVIRQAWGGTFPTYPAIVEKARALRAGGYGMR